MSVRRGGNLENAIMRASRAYRAEGRKLVLVKQEPPIAHGTGYVGHAPVDAIGAFAGVPLAIEAKTVKGQSLPISRLRKEQVTLMTYLHDAGAEVRLIVHFSSVGEVYSVTWPGIATFLALGWRKSWSLAWFRVEGKLLAQIHASTDRWQVRFLEQSDHPDRPKALDELARDKARPRSEKRADEDDVQFDEEIIQHASPFAGMTPDEMRARLRDAAQEGVERQLKIQPRKQAMARRRGAGWMR